MKHCISLLDMGQDEIMKRVELGSRFVDFTRKGGRRFGRIVSRENLLESGILEGRLFDRERELATREVVSNRGDTIEPLVGGLFCEYSIRTRDTFEEAARRLGFTPRFYPGLDHTSIPKGESIANTIRMIVEQQGAEMLVLRLSEEGVARFAAEVVEVPILNGGDGRNRHPSQTLLDLLAIVSAFGQKKFGRDFPMEIEPGDWESLTIAIAGDMSHSRVAHSLLTAARILGFKVCLFYDQETKPPAVWLKGVDIVFEGTKYSDVLKSCDILFLLRPQLERHKHDPMSLARAVARFQVTPQLLDRLCPDILIMHALPIDKKYGMIRLYPSVFNDPRVGFVQTEAGFAVPMRMGLLLLSWLHRHDKVVGPSPPPLEPTVLEEESIERHLRRQRDRGRGYFKPIESGIILDHIPQGQSRVVERMLERAGVDLSGPLIPARNMSSDKMPGGKKDVFVLEHRFPPDYALAAVQMLFPTTTVNICREGVFRKVRFPRPPLIPDVLRCPNPACICNNDPEAPSRFHTVSHGDDEFELLCAFCERTFTEKEILARI